jgi:hypothetical protein
MFSIYPSRVHLAYAQAVRIGAIHMREVGWEVSMFGGGMGPGVAVEICQITFFESKERGTVHDRFMGLDPAVGVFQFPLVEVRGQKRRSAAPALQISNDDPALHP